MRSQVRDRLVLPVLLPLGILVVMVGVLYGFSRILLSLTASGATGVALVAAGAIVVLAAIAASRPQVRASTLAAMVGGTAGVAMLAGGLALAVLAGGEEEGGGEGPAPRVNLVAAELAFQPTSLVVPAGVPFEIAFDNQDDGVQHNVDIFESEDFSGTPLFPGELVTGPAAVTYDVDPLEPGTYFFRCVVHPPMTGEITAKEGPPEGQGGGPGPGGPGGVTVTAQSLAFDTAEIVLPADAPTTITFDNQEAGVQHNISIYSDPSLGETLFQGELVTGPATRRVPHPPDPGWRVLLPV